MRPMKLMLAMGLVGLGVACSPTPAPAPAPSPNVVVNCTKDGECAGLGSGAVPVACCTAGYSLEDAPGGKCGGIPGQSTKMCVLKCIEKDSCLPVVPGAACCSGTTATADTTCTAPSGGGTVIGVQNVRCK